MSHTVSPTIPTPVLTDEEADAEVYIITEGFNWTPERMDIESHNQNKTTEDIVVKKA